MKNLKLAVLLSGSGTTLENIFEHIEDGRLDAEVCLVVSSRADAYGLKRAEKRGIVTHVVPSKKYVNIDEFSDRVTDALDCDKPDLILLAGFMCLYKVPDHYLGKIMNVHPALIPMFAGKGFYGHHVHEAVLARGCKVTGCTVHFVDNVYDNGPIIMQKTVEVNDGDTPDSLAERVQAEERNIYPEAIRLFGEGRLAIEARRVHILPPKT